MATTKEEHLAKAQENLRFRESLDLSLDGAAGWSVTILFYAALHYVEAYFLARRGFGCKNHFSRASEIQSDPRIRLIFPEYRDLENLSREARYDVSKFNDGDLKYALTCFQTIKGAVDAII